MEASYALIAAVIIFLIIVADGLKRLAGTSTPQLRPRGANQTLAEWLMGKEMLAKSDLKLPDLRVKIERSAAFPSEWSCNVPPQLAASPHARTFGSAAAFHMGLPGHGHLADARRDRGVAGRGLGRLDGF